MSQVHAFGRMSVQVITHVLKWRSDDRLTLTGSAEVVVARRGPCNMVAGAGS